MTDTTVPPTSSESKTISQTATDTASKVGSTVTDSATTAAAVVTSAATTAKDNVFSMFGGGPAREKKVEEDVNEPSGSSKAQKKDDDVCLPELF